MEVRPFLGKHSCVPDFQNEPELHESTLLRESGGKLPPYSICCGDRRRVRSIAKFLDNVTFIDEIMEKADKNCGRITVAVGTYRGCPIAVFEHQMGNAACEIITREMVHPDTMTAEFRGPDGTVFSSDAHYLVRIGSCGGINGHSTSSAETVELEDIIISSKNVGIDGTTVQSITGNLNATNLSEEERRRVSSKLEAMGYQFGKDGMPEKPADDSFTKDLREHVAAYFESQGLPGTKARMLGTCAKDSLYAETNEEEFMELRDKHNVGGTEMEFSTISHVAAEYTMRGCPVKAGMCCQVMGVIPGESFGKIDAKKHKLSTTAAIVGVLNTLHGISEKHKNLNSSSNEGSNDEMKESPHTTLAKDMVWGKTERYRRLSRELSKSKLPNLKSKNCEES